MTIKPDRALEVLMSRGFSVTYGAVMTLAFGAVGLFLYNEPPAQLVWIFGAGIHFGITFMWVIAPRITENWKRQMQVELQKITDECVKEGNARMQAEALRIWSPTIAPPDHEPRRGLH